MRLFRLARAGASFVDRVLDGDPVDGASAGERRLLGRLIDAGVVHPQVEPADCAADVTVVVPVRDRAAELGRLLASIADQSAPDRPGSVIVVDDGSSDAGAVASVVRTHRATLVRRDLSSGPAAARNRGSMVVTTPYVAFLDSDTVVTPGWLSRSIGHFEDVRVGIVAPRIRSSGSGVLAAFDEARSPLDLGPLPGRVAPRTRIAYVPAAGLIARTWAMRDLDGFDDALVVGEDVDLVWRAVERGWRVRYEPAAGVVHDVRPTWRTWLRQRYDYGTSAAALDERHPGAVAPVSCSGWTLAAWAAVGLGHPVPGLAVAAGSAAAFPRRVPYLPPREAMRLAAIGHLGAGQLLARAVVRAWWPAAVLASLVSSRARRLVAASVLANATVAAVGARRRGASRAAVVGAISVVDDVAYGAGVWSGCISRRSFRALAPSLQRFPSRTALNRIPTDSRRLASPRDPEVAAMPGPRCEQKENVF